MVARFYILYFTTTKIIVRGKNIIIKQNQYLLNINLKIINEKPSKTVTISCLLYLTCIVLIVLMLAVHKLHVFSLDITLNKLSVYDDILCLCSIPTDLSLSPIVFRKTLVFMLNRDGRFRNHTHRIQIYSIYFVESKRRMCS